MEWGRDIELENELFGRLREEYLEDRTAEMHVSETIQCLTKAFWDKTNPLPVTETELMYFSTGLALEKVYIKGPNIAPAVPRSVHGMICSPDYRIQSFEGEMDLKTTGMWPGPDGSPKNGWPESWLKQFMSYAYGLVDWNNPPEYVDYYVGILYLARPPQLVAGCLRFSRDELVFNMAERILNLQVLQDHLDAGVPPEPFKYAPILQYCKNCKYLDRCQGTDIIDLGE